MVPGGRAIFASFVVGEYYEHAKNYDKGKHSQSRVHKAFLKLRASSKTPTKKSLGNRNGSSNFPGISCLIRSIALGDANAMSSLQLLLEKPCDLASSSQAEVLLVIHV